MFGSKKKSREAKKCVFVKLKCKMRIFMKKYAQLAKLIK